MPLSRQHAALIADNHLADALGPGSHVKAELSNRAALISLRIASTVLTSSRCANRSVSTL